MSDIIRSLKKASSSDADLLKVFQEGAKGVKHDGGPKDRYVSSNLRYENKQAPGPYIKKGPSRSGGPGQYIKSMGR